jgi:hypothetical protein
MRWRRVEGFYSGFGFLGGLHAGDEEMIKGSNYLATRVVGNSPLQPRVASDCREISTILHKLNYLATLDGRSPCRFTTQPNPSRRVVFVSTHFQNLIQ